MERMRVLVGDVARGGAGSVRSESRSRGCQGGRDGWSVLDIVEVPVAGREEVGWWGNAGESNRAVVCSLERSR